MASSSGSCCLRRCMEPPPAARDWAGLPRDVLCIVFLKLGIREIMRGAEFACTAWRRVALKEPALWRRIYMPTIWRYSKTWRRPGPRRRPVRRLHRTLRQPLPARPRRKSTVFEKPRSLRLCCVQ
ncbi:uncharacterized protein [Setaria viridis]|uniref:uncharacterized protein n=1 Tax=Setaria viridis TaxID=4556 RepID=UPI0014938C9D|nr:uncharacterized protein LOC117860283 [Setaria viridis]XP_034601419.1 uncharacterized protein LOC117862019 [Setaria viridis]XP_034601469.1 uncharacterized protein LOC117862063 [Setaria viridis]